MKNIATILKQLVILLCFAPGIIWGQKMAMRPRPLPSAVSALRARWTPLLAPSARAKIEKAALALNAKLALNANNSSANAEVVTEARTVARGQFSGVKESDIEAVVALVMMESSQNMNNDLQKMSEKLDETNKRKQFLSTEYTRLHNEEANLRNQNAPAIDLGKLLAQEQQAKDKLSSMNDLSEMQSMQLQMLMDRYSKFIQTLSNIMKSISSTDDSIVSNLK